MKWMRLFRYLPLLALLLLAGCAQPGLRTDAGQEKPVEAAEIPLSQQLREAAPEIVSYPVSSEHTLTALVPENYTGEDGSGPFYQALAEATGASVSYTILPEAGYEDGRLMDIIAGGELPDLIWGLNEYLLENMEEELLELNRRAGEAGVTTALIRDAGMTEFHGQPTYTALAFEPLAAERADELTGGLPLY